MGIVIIIKKTLFFFLHFNMSVVGSYLSISGVLDFEIPYFLPHKVFGKDKLEY